MLLLLMLVLLLLLLLLLLLSETKTRFGWLARGNPLALVTQGAPRCRGVVFTAVFLGVLTMPGVIQMVDDPSISFRKTLEKTVATAMNYNIIMNTGRHSGPDFSVQV